MDHGVTRGSAMIPFALTGALIGAIVASRVSILALIPTIFCALGIAAVTSLFGQSATVGAVVTLVVGLQIGYVSAAGAYFAGSTLRQRSSAYFDKARTL